MDLCSSPDRFQIWVIVPSSHTQAVRKTLELNKQSDPSSKILNDSTRICSEFIFHTPSPDLPARPCAIPTNIFQPECPSKESSLLLAHRLSILHLLSQPYTHIVALPISSPSHKHHPTSSSDLTPIIHAWLLYLPSHVIPSSASIPSLLSSSTWSYTKYPPLLILPSSAFACPPWRSLLSTLSEQHIQTLYTTICAKLKVTHIAISAPIPLLSTTSSTSASGPASTPATSYASPIADAKPQEWQEGEGEGQGQGQQEEEGEENQMRSPTHFRPLCGDFGRLEPASFQAFDRAFWVKVKQNGIVQCFAPLYTMFSRGNIGEKKRLMELHDLTAAAEKGEGGKEGGLQESCRAKGVEKVNGVTAVDLYAGVGYFAFSYVQAGVERVLCWEINPWSVQGLRRGAEGNRWGVEMGAGPEKKELHTLRGGRLVVFQESNEFARARVERLRKKGEIGPVRHVNCGFLPSSKAIWRDAVAMVDREEGGWVHAHENVATDEIETRRAEVEMLFRGYADAREGQGDEGKSWRDAKCVHVEKVKTYAPGVWHCVFDVHIFPSASRTRQQMPGVDHMEAS